MPLRLGSVRLKLSHASRAPSGDQAEQKVNKVAGPFVGSMPNDLLANAVAIAAPGRGAAEAALHASDTHSHPPNRTSSGPTLLTPRATTMRLGPTGKSIASMSNGVGARKGRRGVSRQIWARMA